MLTRAGCNQGSCHGAAAGRAGLKLSLLGDDPEHDFRALLREAGGRRVNRADPAAKKAFALNEATDAVRERYGQHQFGQSCLLARRLVESGVRLVTVGSGGWDTHQNNFAQLKGKLLPGLDQGYSALLSDLRERGLLESTLVVCRGEFGRTPGVNSQAGRDHWPTVFSATLGGGGVKTGLVIGRSDETGALPAERPVKVEDLAATIYRALRINYHQEYMTPHGRPTPIVYNGEPVHELF